MARNGTSMAFDTWAVPGMGDTRLSSSHLGLERHRTLVADCRIVGRLVHAPTERRSAPVSLCSKGIVVEKGSHHRSLSPRRRDRWSARMTSSISDGGDGTRFEAVAGLDGAGFCGNLGACSATVVRL